jgi:hypothetical protein
MLRVLDIGADLVIIPRKIFSLAEYIKETRLAWPAGRLENGSAYLVLRFVFVLLTAPILINVGLRLIQDSIPVSFLSMDVVDHR